VNIEMLDMPKKHPYGMLQGIGQAWERESFLAWMLIQCIEAGAFAPISTRHEHPEMVELGLVERIGERKYVLTEKAKGLLYSHYWKRPDS